MNYAPILVFMLTCACAERFVGVDDAPQPVACRLFSTSAPRVPSASIAAARLVESLDARLQDVPADLPRFWEPFWTSRALGAGAKLEMLAKAYGQVARRPEHPVGDQSSPSFWFLGTSDRVTYETTVFPEDTAGALRRYTAVSFGDYGFASAVTTVDLTATTEDDLNRAEKLAVSYPYCQAPDYGESFELSFALFDVDHRRFHPLPASYRACPKRVMLADEDDAGRGPETLLDVAAADAFRRYGRSKLETSPLDVTPRPGESAWARWLRVQKNYALLAASPSDEFGDPRSAYYLAYGNPGQARYAWVTFRPYARADFGGRNDPHVEFAAAVVLRGWSNGAAVMQPNGAITDSEDYGDPHIPEYRAAIALEHWLNVTEVCP